MTDITTHLTNASRSILTVLIGLTLCATVLIEQCDGLPAPTWFTAFGLSVVGEWTVEWAVYWRKKGVI